MKLSLAQQAQSSCATNTWRAGCRPHAGSIMRQVARPWSLRHPSRSIRGCGQRSCRHCRRSPGGWLRGCSGRGGSEELGPRAAQRCRPGGCGVRNRRAHEACQRVAGRQGRHRMAAHVALDRLRQGGCENVGQDLRLQGQKPRGLVGSESFDVHRGLVGRHQLGSWSLEHSLAYVQLIRHAVMMTALASEHSSLKGQAQRWQVHEKLTRRTRAFGDR